MADKILRLFFFLLLSLPLGAASGAALESVVFDREFELDFKPVRGNFIIELRLGEVLLRPAIIPEVPQTSEIKDKFTGIVGTRLELPHPVTSCNVALILHGEQGKIAYLPVRRVEISKKILGLNSSDKLRKQLLLRKELLHSWSLQLEEQERSLGRLREDAEVIGNVGRILELQEETAKAQAESINLERDFDTLKKFLALIKSHPAPHNFERRERELTRQLAMLASAAKQAESGELERKFRRESELQFRLEVLESTREEDLQTLKQQLADLRVERMHLEKELGVTDQAQVPVED